MIKKLLWACCIACLITPRLGLAEENLVYMLRDGLNPSSNITDFTNSLATLQKNAAVINIVVPQAFVIDEKGKVAGGVNPALIAFAKQQQLKLMPLVTNSDYSDVKIHKFLENKRAQQQAINTLVAACGENKFYGIQFDFEGIVIADKDKLTTFYRNAATELHKNQCKMSVTIYPRLSDDPPESDYQKALYQGWNGAYDYKALGETADFITLMAYDQHLGGTTPGPVASIAWDEALIRYALKYIPAEKISLGIPAYSDYWATVKKASGRIGSALQQIPYKTVQDLLTQFHSSAQWSNQDKVHYAIYEHNYLNEYIFIEDMQSFAAKLALVKKYHLRGISIWRLNMEDPRIWEVLHPHNTKKEKPIAM